MFFLNPHLLVSRFCCQWSSVQLFIIIKMYFSWRVKVSRCIVKCYFQEVFFSQSFLIDYLVWTDEIDIETPKTWMFVVCRGFYKYGIPPPKHVSDTLERNKNTFKVYNNWSYNPETLWNAWAFWYCNFIRTLTLQPPGWRIFTPIIRN